MELCRAYLHGWKKREEPEEHICDFFFTSSVEKAAYWSIKIDADLECAFWDSLQISIELKNRGAYICRGFEPEELPDGQFAIACKIPPLSEQASA